MPINVRPWFLWFDGSTDTRHALQGEDPVGSQYVPIGVKNIRPRTNPVNNQNYQIGDIPVVARGSKEIIWSSEGYTNPLGVAVPALTANQKKATGSHNANAGGTLGTVAGALDLSPYHAIGVIAVLASFTGGTTPSLQFEIDFIDDTGTPNVVPIWKPTAATAATSYITGVGLGLGTAPTVTGYTALSLDFPVLPNGQFQWTIAGAPTAVAWTAVVYGIS